MASFGNAQTLVAIDEIRENVLVMKGGELRQVIMVGGINFSLKSEAEQNVLTAAYQEFLNSLNFQIQIIIHSRKINIEKYLRSLDERKSGEPSALLQDQIGEYQEFIRSFVAENAIMTKTFFVVVPYTPVALPSRENILSAIPFLKKDPGQATKDAAAKDTTFRENLGQLNQRVNQVMEGLASISLETTLLNEEQLIELFYNFYNPETTEKETVAH